MKNAKNEEKNIRSLKYMLCTCIKSKEPAKMMKKNIWGFWPLLVDLES